MTSVEPATNSSREVATEHARGEFRSKLFTQIHDFLPQRDFTDLKAELLALPQSLIDRSYVPGHKKGGAIGYDRLRKYAPRALALYKSSELCALLSAITECELKTTHESDMSSLSLLMYTEPGDHINWHFDHNFYPGRHFTVLIPIENRGEAEGGLSHGELQRADTGGNITASSFPNTLTLFEGAKVLHRVTLIHENERRVALSMTFCTNENASAFMHFVRRAKDTAFFGFSAFWRR